MEQINKFLIACVIVCLIVFTNICYKAAAQVDNPEINERDKGQISQVLNNMFDALRSGDTETLKRLFAGEMYANNKTLLEKNTGYPDFLRNHYQDAIFTVTEISRNGDEITASFTIYFADGREKIVNMLFEKHSADALHNASSPGLSENEPTRWFIVKQIKNE